jgi:hypothetical protein
LKFEEQQNWHQAMTPNYDTHIENKTRILIACKTSFNSMQVHLPLKYNTYGSIDYLKTHLAQHKDFIKPQVLILTNFFSCCQT